MKWYLLALKNYANFCGRSTRKEYWMFALFTSIFFVVSLILDNILGVAWFGYYGLFYMLYSIFVFIPSLSVSVRRLHDTGRSGWNLLWSILPIIGGIIIFVFLVQKGDAYPNEYNNQCDENIL